MDFLTAFVATIPDLGLLGYVAVFAVTLIESLAFVGIFLPGGTLVVTTGFLAAQGYLDLTLLIWFAAAGAVIGDGLSYYLGTKGIRFFRPGNRLFKLSHLERGEAFFKKHGHQSVFWGRFISPLRPIVPFVAGLSKMDKWTFLFWNVASALAWAVSFLLGGYLLGTTLQAVGLWAGQVELILFLLPTVGLLLWLVIKRVSKRQRRTPTLITHE